MPCASTPTCSDRILPIYLVCDLSSSMSGEGRADALQDALAELRDAIWANPVVSDSARIGVVGFAGTAWVVLPLCDIATVDELPDLNTAGVTSYAAAFRLLRGTISQDVAQLGADGYGVWRPLVFFISDGEPTDPRSEWHAEHARLVDRAVSWSPEIVSFAVGEASPKTLAFVATTRCFSARSGEAVRDAIAGVAHIVVRSVVASTTAGQPMVPNGAPMGFDEVDFL